MNPYGHSPEPPDTREQPECCCPLEGPECQECPEHGEYVAWDGLAWYDEDGEAEDIPW